MKILVNTHRQTLLLQKQENSKFEKKMIAELCIFRHTWLKRRQLVKKSSNEIPK